MLPNGSAVHAASAVNLTLLPGQRVALTFGLTWHFPHRLWASDTDLGQYYANLYSSAQDVANASATRLTRIVRAAAAWHGAGGRASGDGAVGAGRRRVAAAAAAADAAAGESGHPASASFGAISFGAAS